MPAVGTLTVEIMPAGSWIDITGYVSSNGRVSITRGRRDEQSSPSPATCALTLVNDGRFSPGNASSPYWPGLTLSLPIRVSVTDDSGTPRVRFLGVVCEYTQDLAMPDGGPRFLAIRAVGSRARLGRPNAPLATPFARAVAALPNLISWFPLTDGTQAQLFGSGLAGQPAITNTGSAPSSNDSFFLCSDPVVVLTAPETLSAPIPFTPAAGYQCRMLFQTGAVDGGSGITATISTDLAHKIVMTYAPFSGLLDLALVNQSSGVVESDLGPITTSALSSPVLLSIKLAQSGGDIAAALEWLPVGSVTPGSLTGTFTLATLGRPTQVTIACTGASGKAAVGHLTLQTTQTTLAAMAPALAGYAGETAAARASRIAGENGVPITVAGTPAATEAMGVQTSATFLDIFDGTALADAGISSEPLGVTGLAWRARTDLLSQTAAVAFDQTDVMVIEPTFDDQACLNDVTVSRPGGSSARAVVTTGPFGTANLGTYAESVELNLLTDAQLLAAAQRRVAHGTVVAERVPRVEFEALSALDATQRAGLFGVTEGSVVSVAGLSAGSGLPNPVRLLVLGWTEVVGYNTWSWSLNTVPADTYDVLILDSVTFGIIGVARIG